MVSKRVESLLNQLRTQGIVDERVLEAIALVPREKFVDEAFEHKAWENTALPIGPCRLPVLQALAVDLSRNRWERSVLVGLIVMV